MIFDAEERYRDIVTIFFSCRKNIYSCNKIFISLQSIFLKVAILTF